jgi:adenylosuccinate lyase
MQQIHTMGLSPLTTISPVDGRYQHQTGPLGPYFSELALIRYRVRVEIEYFIALCELPLPQLSDFDTKYYSKLRSIYTHFSMDDAIKIKDIEKTTNHDVKAVEYFIKDKFDDLKLTNYREFIHFGLTSQDINNTAIPLLLKEGLHTIIYPLLENIINKIEIRGQEWIDIPMLARTHGQPASPTKLGKELLVFEARLKSQLNTLKQSIFSAKFGGATGNFNAHYATYPDTEWHQFGKDFVENILGLTRSYPTTQIDHYDHLASICHNFMRINNILIDLCRDVWQYISLGYFRQKIKENEVGSSAMPHKVNPIDFENAEGNLGIANAILGHLANKLPISRLQRDLTDSTVLRNLGVPFGHILISLNSMQKGFDKLELNKSALLKDLQENWAVVAEGIQNILRREGYPNPYEALKELTRTNERISHEDLSGFIDSLEISDKVKEELKMLSPFNYTGK